MLRGQALLPTIHIIPTLPPDPHPRYYYYCLSADVSPALHLSSAIGPLQRTTL
jgi:hypothetical protein